MPTSRISISCTEAWWSFLKLGRLPYRYAAPFRHRGLEVLRDLRAPVCSRPSLGDSLYSSHKLYPKSAWTEIMPREPEAAALAERAILERHPARGAPPPAPACAALPGRTTTDYLDIDGVQVLVRSAGELPVRCLCSSCLTHRVLPSSTTRSFGVRTSARARFSWPWRIPILSWQSTECGDLGGHGTKVLDRLNVQNVRLYGHNGGAAVAVELARRLAAGCSGWCSMLPVFSAMKKEKPFPPAMRQRCYRCGKAAIGCAPGTICATRVMVALVRAHPSRRAHEHAAHRPGRSHAAPARDDEAARELRSRLARRAFLRRAGTRRRYQGAGARNRLGEQEFSRIFLPAGTSRTIRARARRRSGSGSADNDEHKGKSLKAKTTGGR